MMVSPLPTYTTVQDITEQILLEVDQIEFPFTPFLVEGIEHDQLRLADLIQDDILYLRDMMEWWLEDREKEKWKVDNKKVPLRVIRCLRSIHLDSLTLFSLTDGEEADNQDYTDMLLSYIVNLGMIATTLSDWMHYLLKQEQIYFRIEEIHCALGVVL